ncbi:MAG: BatD family protein [Bacteroidota bacterium]|nr:BatD family protein [Bacteroidota bacterium]
MTRAPDTRISLALFAVFLLVLFQPVVHPQDVSFTASPSKTEVALDEQFQLTYTLAGGSLKQYSDFRQPNLNANFLTLAGPSTSQSMQWVNGRMSSSISWIYVLQPRAVGTYTIPPATIVYDGRPMKSNAVTIKVVSPAPSRKQPDPRGKEDQDIPLGNDLFVRASVEKRTAFVGEPIFVTYKLYSRVRFRIDNISKIPRMVGFWSEDIDMPSQIRPEIEILDGNQYEVYTLKKVVYFPTQAGTLTIDPFEINCTVQVRKKRRTGDDFFDRFFNDPFFDSYQDIRKTLTTDRITINVKPLPDEGKPESFRGAVGSYTMEASIDKTTLKVNESAVLKVVIRGTGNIKLLEEPIVEFPNGVEHFEPQIAEDIIRQGSSISGTKTFEYVFIPRYPGSMEFKPVTFAWFDLDKRAYRKAVSNGWSLTVLEGKQQLVDGSSSVPGNMRDIHGLMAQVPEFPSSPIPPLWVFMFLYLTPIAAGLGGLVLKRRYDRIHSDPLGMRMRRATRIAERHLAASKRFLRSGDTEAYYHEIARALWGYVQNKLALPTSETSTSNVIETLRGRGAGEDTVACVHEALMAIEEARFSPLRATDATKQSLYDAARRAMVSMEDALRI